MVNKRLIDELIEIAIAEDIGMVITHLFRV